MNLPWDLEFTAVPIPAASVAMDFDGATSELHVTLTNRSSEPLHPQELRLEAELDVPTAAGSLWIHGRYMQADTLIRTFGEPQEEGYDGRYAAPLDDGRRYTSREVVAIQLQAQPAPVLLLGSLRPGEVFFDVDLDVDADETRTRQLALVFDLRGADLAAGATLELPPIVLSEGRDPTALIERFADEVGTRMGARVPAYVPTGWCSWYYFYNRVSEADVVANLAEMVRTAHPADYVQIDDGYQSFTGDWLAPNAKFPSGMAALATSIREAGYKPGLWLAPFVLHEDSVALRENPQLALKTAEGETIFVQTWLGRCAVLDCTHPDTEAWLRNVIRTVVHDWGYEYLKLDALTFAARPGDTARYHAPGTTAPMNVRRGLQIIREAAGDETFILGCTCHFGAAIGLVDAMRVGPDVKELWSDGPNPSVKHAMRLTLQRNWMHRRWWLNDPDCLIVRDTDTALTEAETRFLATGIALSGGLVVASDDLPKLPPARRDVALALFPSPGAAAQPLHPFDGPVPSTWRADLGDGRFLVGALNWTETAMWLQSGELFRPGEIAFDVWNGRALGMGDRLLQPHEGALWQVVGRGPTPRVVGDTASLTYTGLFQRQVSGRVQVRNDLARERTIAVEARGQVLEATLAPGEMRWFD